MVGRKSQPFSLSIVCGLECPHDVHFMQENEFMLGMDRLEGGKAIQRDLTTTLQPKFEYCVFFFKTLKLNFKRIAALTVLTRPLT